MKRRSQKLRNERTSYCESSVDAFCVRTMTKIAAKLAERRCEGQAKPTCPMTFDDTQQNEEKSEETNKRK